MQQKTKVKQIWRFTNAKANIFLKTNPETDEKQRKNTNPVVPSKGNLLLQQVLGSGRIVFTSYYKTAQKIKF